VPGGRSCFRSRRMTSCKPEEWQTIAPSRGLAHGIQAAASSMPSSTKGGQTLKHDFV